MIEFCDGKPLIEGLDAEGEALLVKYLGGVNSAGIRRVEKAFKVVRRNPNGAEQQVLSAYLKGEIMLARIGSELDPEPNRTAEMDVFANTLCELVARQS